MRSIKSISCIFPAVIAGLALSACLLDEVEEDELPNVEYRDVSFNEKPSPDDMSVEAGLEEYSAGQSESGYGVEDIPAADSKDDISTEACRADGASCTSEQHCALLCKVSGCSSEYSRCSPVTSTCWCDIR